MPILASAKSDRAVTERQSVLEALPRLIDDGEYERWQAQIGLIFM